MKLKFCEVKPMQQCFEEAFEHILNAKKRGSSGLTKIKNLSGYRNRVVSYAVLFYLRGNWKKTDLIDCELRAAHYGVALGTVMERTVEYGDINTTQYIKLLKQARKISQSADMSAFA